MLLSIINFLLVFSISVNTLLIILLIRQKPKLPVIALYSYIVFLITLDCLGALYILNSPFAESNLLLEKSRFILQCFILAIIYYFASSFTYSRSLAKPSALWAGIFLAALLPAGLALAERIIPGVALHSGYLTATYLPLFGIFVAFFLAAAVMLYREIARRGQTAKTDNARALIKPIKHIIFPLGILSLASIYLLPFFLSFHPLMLAPYAIFSTMLYYSALRFQILELDRDTRYILPQLLVIAFFLLFYYLSVGRLPINSILLSIPLFIASVWVAHTVLLFFIGTFENTQIGYNELLDKQLERFATDMVRFLEAEQLWEHVAAFCSQTFQTNRIAILTLQYDVSPYQIAYTRGFEPEVLEKMLPPRSSQLMEQLEVKRDILNKFDFDDTSNLFKEMDEAGIYLGIPVSREHELLGLIFLGGERRFVPVPRRYVHLLRLMSSQLAIAIEKLHAIRHSLQAEKMAGIGMLSSQIAHDFRSFITLVKMHTRDSENERLEKHAGYVEKLVKDLLNYTQPQQPQKTQVQVNQLIDMCLDLLTIPENVSIDRVYGENLPKIYLDIHQMRRVIANLIENSVRSLQDSTVRRITITTRSLQPISKVSRHPWISIDISDVGSGIEGTFLERIFDPFFTTYKREGGTGLGLAIVKQIVSMHAGFVTVSSEKDQGTTVTIRLPYQSV